MLRTQIISALDHFGFVHLGKNPGRFGPFPVRSGRFGLGFFSPISEVSHFGPTGMDRFGPISKVRRFDSDFMESGKMCNPHPR